MSKIIPHLWFDREAKEAAELYVSIFENSRIQHSCVLPGTPSGPCEVVSLELEGQPFQFLSAGPLFPFNPSISFLVACPTAERVDQLWGQLSEGASVLMPLDSYPFSERYVWLADRYGVNWQLMLRPESRQVITPVLMFAGPRAGQAEPASQFYTSIFPNSAIEYVDRYQEGEAPDRPGTVRHTGFSLNGFRLAAMDSAHPHQFDFNEAVSLMVSCQDQAEIDHYWEKLSAVPEAEQCGWLKDQFGISWQIVPAAMDEMMARGDAQTLERVVQAFLPMKKLELARIESAYRGS